MAGDSAGSSASEGSAADPGFGDIPGQEALPDMRDVLPTFDESYGDASGSSEGEGETQGSGDASGTREGQDNPSGSSGSDTYGQRSGTQGTRAAGGMEGMAGVDGSLTTMEQVAILDRQLEQSTSDFDALILEEQQRQREMERSRQPAARQEPEPAGQGGWGQSTAYNETGNAGSLPSNGDSGGLIYSQSSPIRDEELFETPDDIPKEQDDDVVARQLRELAEREPNPELREYLWNQYREYIGLEVPKE